MLIFAEQKAKIAKLNLIDNGFFQKVMQDKESCEEVLRIILQKPNLKVLENQIERNIPNMTGHAVTLYLICEDDNGNIINVEVQKANDTNHQKRVRYNMACMDTLSIDKGTNYHDLPDLYVVFISAFDMFKENKTIYHAQRILRETGTFIENGTHEIYVNTKIDDGSDIAQLMQYFKNSNGIHPLFKKLSSQIHYYKETAKGVNDMVDVWEEYANERANEKVAEQNKITAINFFNNGVPIETIIKSVPSLPAEFIEQLKQMPAEHIQNA